MSDHPGERRRRSVFGRGARLARGAGAVAAPVMSAALHRVGRRASELPETVRRRRNGATTAPRGWVLRGRVWTGDVAEPFDGAVVVDDSGRVVRCAPNGQIDWPPDLPTIGGTGWWVGPGVVDAHVHLQFADPSALLAAGLVAVRDLGGPPTSARQWRTGHRTPRAGRPFIAVSGPILTATGGYPTRSWGPAVGAFVDSPAAARSSVLALAADGVDVIKVALEPGPGWPVPSPSTVRAVVHTAHRAGLAVCAHALTAQMVRRAVDAGVDELAHIPTDRLDDDLVERIAEAGVAVVSTLQTFFADGLGRAVAANAGALVAAGVELRYGTDLGNTGTQPGVDPRELDRLADAGLGRLGALRAATLSSARAPGIRGRSGLIRLGQPAALVVLPADPTLEPGAWRTPTAVIADNRLVRPGGARAGSAPPDTLAG
ncbi:MAG: amidohydrolase family protein [bacterium]